MIKLYVYDNEQELAEHGALIIQELIQAKPNAVLGLATGSTPVGMYQALIARYQANKIDFSKVRTVNLDEYLGLEPSHPQSYRYFMNENLFNHINIDKQQTHVPDGLAPDGEKACEQYDELIESLGYPDIQVLGVGANGHIGFNEPASTLTAPTHLEVLKTSTIEANARFFNSIDEVPTSAITMGLGAIFQAKRILLLATGEAKAEAIASLMSPKLDPNCPVSMLKLHHDVVVLVDRKAAKLLAV